MALEGGDQSYRPSWKVRLTIRLEEFDSGVLKKRTPGKLTKNLNGLRDDGTDFEIAIDPENPKRWVFRNKKSAKTVLIPPTSDDGLTHVVSGIIPKSFDWKVNGIRAADELRVSIRAEDFPIDPRVCRSIGIEFFLGTLTAVEYAQGARGRTRGEVFGSTVPNANEPLSVVPDFYVDDLGNRRTNLRFEGWVDKDKLALADNAPPWIEFECRDHTQLLLGQGAPPKLVIGGKDPLDKAVATYLANFPQFAGFSVEYAGVDGAPAPSLEKVLAGSAMRPELGPQPKGDDDLTVWDYITDVCGSIGHVAYVDGTRIILARPATVLSGVASTRSDDPYRARKLASANYPVRAMIYGRNLSNLEISRDFANREAKNIEVRSYSPKKKQVLVARFPTKDSRIPSSTPGSGAADNKWNVVHLRGVESQQLLEEIAEDYYNSRSRSELEVTIKTKCFASFGGGNADPDLLDLKATDAIEIAVDRGGDASWSKIEKQLVAREANAQRLISLGFTDRFAKAYASAYASAGLQRLFRLREMSVSGDVDDGVSFEIRAANFVQVRGEIRNPAKPAAKPANTKPAAKQAAKTSSPASPPSPVAPPGTKIVGTRPDGSPILVKA